MAKSSPKLVKIASHLEIELLAAVVKGAASPSIVEDKELSKIGRIVRDAIIQLSKNGLQAPYRLSTIYTNCVAHRGAPPEDTREFLKALRVVFATKDHAVLLRVAKQKEALVGILNEASKQLGNGLVDLKKFNEIADKQQDAGEKLVAMSEIEPGEPPMGVEIPSLPVISQATRGVQGVWIFGGYEGIGKSTLVLQFGIEIQRTQPVLYYDIDGTGEVWMRYRIEQAVGKENYVEASKNLFYRPAIDSLDNDLLSIPAPATLVIDSIQTLPYQINQRRSSVDHWLSSFKALTNKGYTVLVISELSREGDYKESSGINYAGAVNLMIERDEQDSPFLRVIAKKIRHAPNPRSGHLVTLERDAQYPYWFNEV